MFENFVKVWKLRPQQECGIFICLFSYMSPFFSQSFSMQEDASRSRQALSNEYLVVRPGLDTEANEPSKVWSIGIWLKKRDNRDGEDEARRFVEWTSWTEEVIQIWRGEGSRLHGHESETGNFFQQQKCVRDLQDLHTSAPLRIQISQYC